MSDAPERITVHTDREGVMECRSVSVDEPVEDVWTSRVTALPVGTFDVEYVRADLYAALEAEVEGCEEEALEWKQMYEDMDNQAQQYCNLAKDLEAQRDLLLHWLCSALEGGDDA